MINIPTNFPTIKSSCGLAPDRDMWLHHVPCGGRRTICILAEEEAGEEEICIREVIIYTSTCSRITMETSISSRRPISFSISSFFLFLLSTEVSVLGKRKMSNEECHSKTRESKNRASYSPSVIHSKTLKQNEKHANPSRMQKNRLKENTHITRICIWSGFMIPPLSVV